MASGNAVKSEQLGKSDERQLTPSPNDPIHTTNGIINSMDKHFPITRGMDNEENGAATEFIAHYGDGRPANVEENGRKIVNAKYSDEVFCRTTVKVPGVKQDPRGAIKELTDGEEDARNQSASEADDDDDDDDDDDEYEEFNDRVDNYSCYARLEAMMLSNSNKDCSLSDGTCTRHTQHSMLQIFSIKLAKVFGVDGSMELYGYIAARDLRDPLLNYIVNIGRDNPIIVEQGSIIEIGPKRGIDLSRAVLVEYDMRIKTGERDENDLQLIDGVSCVNEILTSSNPVINRIHGDYGAVDITRACLDYAFEATVDVVISEVQTGFNLCVGCFTSGLHEEIQLFDGVIGESRGLRRHVRMWLLS
ncbi:hypothetical protein OsJ_15006 [Oryza sativa Japonica Group]|uniref:DUF6598 domain-containing protein n=1 Tax=Oryza sativa subsp. japonica TaxID=39947 RepID=B9FFG6_ORYSJ|nr:hypothetical protein OsJ_15006 [Oryza sativa Japonica Group]